MQPESLLDEIKREVSEYSRRSQMKSFKMSHHKQNSKESTELRNHSVGQLERLPEEEEELVLPPKVEQSADREAAAQSSGSDRQIN